MDIASRDKQIYILRQVLKDKHNFLNEKTNEIKNISKENKLMMDVAEDYYKFNYIIKKRKIEQCVSLDVISKYISDISNTLDNAAEILDESKWQQQEIQTHMDRLRDEIDHLE